MRTEASKPTLEFFRSAVFFAISDISSLFQPCPLRMWLVNQTKFTGNINVPTEVDSSKAHTKFTLFFPRCLFHFFYGTDQKRTHKEGKIPCDTRNSSVQVNSWLHCFCSRMKIQGTIRVQYCTSRSYNSYGACSFLASYFRLCLAFTNLVGDVTAVRLNLTTTGHYNVLEKCDRPLPSPRLAYTVSAIGWYTLRSFGGSLSTTELHRSKSQLYLIRKNWPIKSCHDCHTVDQHQWITAFCRLKTWNVEHLSVSLLA